MKLVVTIPAYNEEDTIAKVIAEIPRQIPGIDKVEVVVVDDGSRDNTVQEALRAGADRVVSFQRNKGLASAFRRGLEVALEMGADIIVNTDADFQYNQAQIPALIQPILDHRADMVLGSRFKGRIESMPMRKKLTNRFVTWMVRRASGYPVSDAQTGFRAFAQEAALMLNVLSKYTYTQETIMQAVNHGLVIQEVPVDFRKRQGESRLISSLMGYATRGAPILLRTYWDYHPLVFFFSIGIMSILAAIAVGLTRFLWAGTLGPYVSVVTTLAAFGSATLLIGLVADTLRTQRRLQEELLFRLKRLELDRSKAAEPHPGVKPRDPLASQ